MKLTANIELLLTSLKAELAILEARLAAVLHQVEGKAETAGVEMPKAPAATNPSLGAPTNPAPVAGNGTNAPQASA